MLAWKRGNRDLAEEYLTEARTLATGHTGQWLVNGMTRWWLGEILVEDGRLQEAEGYFASFMFDPTVDRRLGEIYAETGELEKAREHYQRFLTAWKDAEPEMEPEVAKVRQALAGIAPLRRE